MLVLTMNHGEKIILNNTKDGSTIKICASKTENRRQFRIGIEAPKHIIITREKNGKQEWPDQEK